MINNIIMENKIQKLLNKLDREGLNYVIDKKEARKYFDIIYYIKRKIPGYINLDNIDEEKISMIKENDSILIKITMKDTTLIYNFYSYNRDYCKNDINDISVSDRCPMYGTIKISVYKNGFIDKDTTGYRKLIDVLIYIIEIYINKNK